MELRNCWFLYLLFNQRKISLFYSIPPLFFSFLLRISIFFLLLLLLLRQLLFLLFARSFSKSHRTSQSLLIPAFPFSYPPNKIPTSPNSSFIHLSSPRRRGPSSSVLRFLGFRWRSAKERKSARPKGINPPSGR